MKAFIQSFWAVILLHKNYLCWLRLFCMTRCSWILCMKIDRRRTHNKPEELSSIVNAAFGLRWTTPKISRFRGFTYGFTERGKPENLHEYWTFRIKVRWVRPQSRSSRTSVQQAIIYSLIMLKKPGNTPFSGLFLCLKSPDSDGEIWGNLTSN